MIGKRTVKADNVLAFEGQTAIVTGGAQGIGEAVTRRLLVSGCNVAIWDINAAQLADTRGSLADEFGEDRVAGLPVDITLDAAVEDGARQVREKFGTIDVLIANAGLVGPNLPLAEYPFKDWLDVINTNVNGTFLCMRHVVPYMRSRNYGRIVAIASIAGKEGNPNASAYSASKAAIIGMTKSLGKELADHDIAVNCVTPAVAATPGAMRQSQAHIEYMLSKIPRGRFLELDEASAMICWLASAENSFSTGAVFDLSGGRATY